MEVIKHLQADDSVSSVLSRHLNRVSQRYAEEIGRSMTPYVIQVMERFRITMKGEVWFMVGRVMEEQLFAQIIEDSLDDE